MKVVPLTPDEAKALQASYTTVEEAKTALDKAYKANGQAQADYSALCTKLMTAYKLQDGGPSDDQCYLYGCSMPEVQITPIDLDEQG